MSRTVRFLSECQERNFTSWPIRSVVCGLITVYVFCLGRAKETADSAREKQSSIFSGACRAYRTGPASPLGPEDIAGRNPRPPGHSYCSRVPTPDMKKIRVSIKKARGIPNITIVPDFEFPDMPCMKKLSSDKQASVHWSAARTKSARGPMYKPLVKRTFLSPHQLIMGIRLFVHPKILPGQLPTMPLWARGTVVSWANRPTSVLAQPGPARPAAPPHAAPPRTARGMSGFWNRQI